MKHRETEDYYRARAAEYEQIYYRKVPERRREIADEIRRLSKLVDGKKVLELACGTGYWTQAMSQTAQHITAVDLSGEMISEARKKRFVCPVEFIEADMFGYPYPKQEYDIVSVGFWFSHQAKQEYERFFDLVSGPLKDDGAIWLIDNNPPAEGANFESAGSDEFGNNYKQRWLEDGRQFVILKNYFDRQQLVDIFSRPFIIRDLIYKTYYWSVLLRKKL
jgi:cyclopropane fatty-acyl-phospholipid synthase-like methyltransferase